MSTTQDSSRTEIGVETPPKNETSPSEGSEAERPSSPPTQAAEETKPAFQVRPPAQKLHGWRLIVVEVW